MSSVLGCSPSGSRYGNVPNELIHRAGPPFLDNHYRGYQHAPNTYRTPLHCAAAYRNLDIIRYLVQNGSSLFLATQDGDSPLKIAIEEYEVERQSKVESDQDPENRKPKGTPQMAVECLHFLMGEQTLNQ